MRAIHMHYSRRFFRDVFLAVLFMKGGFLLPCQAQEHTVREIKVPYALSWGDTVEKLRALINAVKGHETGF